MGTAPPNVGRYGRAKKMTAAATHSVAQVTTNQVKGVMNDSLALWYLAKLDVSLFHDV